MPDEKAKLAKTIDNQLKKLYPVADCALEHSNPLELLVATILSAQCTDARVNQVTKELFLKYKTSHRYWSVPAEELESDIRSTGFYRNKAKSIQKACRDIDEKHGGALPDTMEELVKLAGVGRKTANVVLGVAFGKAEGITVDTHVARLSNRWGLTNESDPVKIERALMELVPKKEWIGVSHRIILFGREWCQAKKPRCGDCPIGGLCQWEGKKA